MDADLTNFAKKARAYYEDRRAEMIKYIPKDVKTCLEFGCAFGRFSALIKECFGAETWGVEIDKRAFESGYIFTEKTVGLQKIWPVK